MATEKNCTQCNKNYYKPSNKAYWQFAASQFCSKSCKGKAQGFQKKEPLKKNCIVCNKEYSKPSNQQKIWWESSKYCSQSCYIGERKSNAQYITYRGSENQTWKRQVKKRDSYQCRINNGDCSGTLEVHHILRFTDYPELRYDINNGITLCHFHHPRKKIDEQRLVPIFKELIWQL